MSHLFFCGACSEPAVSKCGGCMEVRYCSQDCQHAVWEEHKAECGKKTAERLERELFACVCARVGRDANQYPFENFKGFMKHQAHLHDKRTVQEWMEDWLLGDMERKMLLRGIFHKNGLKWSVDAYTLYVAWAEGRTGNRFEKMTAFVKATRWMF